MWLRSASDRSQVRSFTTTSLRTSPVMVSPSSVATGVCSRIWPSRTGTSNCQPSHSSEKPFSSRNPSPISSALRG